MRYRELVQFDPIESVKQLRSGGSHDQAAEDVRSYVISESMRDVLTGVVFPQLRFDNPDVDHKGLLLVATYGTGKTHLMSAIAGVAENSDLVSHLTDGDAAAAAAPIAGRFKVVRIEIGAVKMGLRDILASEMTKGLAGIGVTYEFAPLEQVSSNKDSLAEMMAAFESVHPDHGLLVVVDELLDYLRTRKDSELILDLGFLREMGEFCDGSRFRIIAGVQEMLWDNPRFALAQDEIRRVRERYQQFRISRDDVAYVVRERLLRKDESQRSLIREHLTGFAPAFESMGSALADFVDLFPVHPAYLRTFESLTVVEKRRILETLSTEMRSRLDDDVPTDDPGLLCFDAYRADLDADPSNRVIPEIKEVLDRSRVLRERVERGLRNSADIPPALRVIDGLTVHRLTTDDIYTPIGLTTDELRDDLCLLPPDTPELDPAFISSTIESIVDEIRLAVSGQFLSVNDANGQVFIDLKKTVDYEQQIEERAAALDDDALDSAYYKALERVLEVNDDPYVSGYRIWQYELPWATHKVSRLGYLFMGAPNERSTAQPPRDFYVYFLQPYSPHDFVDESKTDEVFLRLVDPDENFTKALRRYAGAAQKAVETTLQHRGAFEQRRDAYLSEMVAWLRKNMATHVQVTYKGEQRLFGQWLGAASGTRRTVKDQADAIAAHVLEAHFGLRYPGYPKFPDGITRSNLGPTVQASLQTIARRRDTALGRTALQGLQLLDINGAISADGPYAQHLLEQLSSAGGKAVNRNDLLVERDLGVWTWGPWHLEPAWLVVVAAALAYLGKAEVGMPTGTVGATQLERLADTPLDDLERISHVAPPTGLDIATLRRVAQLVGVTPGAVTEHLEADVVAQLLNGATTLDSAGADSKNLVLENPRLWGEELFDDPATRAGRIDALLAVTSDVKERKTVGKMRHVAFTDEQLSAAEVGSRELQRVKQLKSVYDRLRPATDYLSTASSILGGADPFDDEADALRKRLRDVLRADAIDMTAAAGISTDAEQLKAKYRRFAVDAHNHDRLDGAGDHAKQTLVQGPAWNDVGRLSQISILPAGKVASLEVRLASLGTCKTFNPSHFDHEFVCPDCRYQPSPTKGPSARAAVTEIETLVADTRREFLDTLADSLASEELAEGLPFLKPASQALVSDFLRTKDFPDGVPEDFVEAANRLLQRFTIVNVTKSEMWNDVMVGATSLTVDELATRLQEWVDGLARGADRGTVRIVPSEENGA